MRQCGQKYGSALHLESVTSAPCRLNAGSPPKCVRPVRHKFCAAQTACTGTPRFPSHIPKIRNSSDSLMPVHPSLAGAFILLGVIRFNPPFPGVGALVAMPVDWFLLAQSTCCPTSAASCLTRTLLANEIENQNMAPDNFW